MDLLKYEFLNSPEGSYNDLITQLVKQIRYYRTKVSVDEFKAAMPQLQAKERELQNIDESVGEETRYFIQEIMDELSIEDEIREKALDEIQRSSQAIIMHLHNTNCSVADFAYEFINSEAVSWIEFYGYKLPKKADETLHIIKEVFRSICYKYNIIFIDSSQNED